MILLLVLHFAAAMVAPSLVRRFGPATLYFLALVPLVAVGYAASKTQQVFVEPLEKSVSWVPQLSLNLVLRMDVLSWLMTLIVAGVGALVLVYSAKYFPADSRNLGKFTAFFLAFAGAMLGVALADQTMTFYMFWELTSVMSYLLIGFHHGRRPARSAARQAFLVTGATALAMFGGLVMLGQSPGGSYRFSNLVPALQDGTLDPHSPVVITGAILVLLGAFGKSAQAPFHFWLSGAMAAPTPVSAYLHAAAMVKAGIYLIARLTPGATLIPGWSALAVIFGLVTMIIGAYRAMKQRDLKLVLAYGTVSQLGFMTASIGLGSASAMAAGIVVLVAHSLFKSSLFLTVGAVESSTGTRNLWELSGLWRKLPLLAFFAALSSLSMAGIPLTVGYLGKEGVIAALYSGTGAAWLAGSPGAEKLMLVVVAIGSALSVAYTWRMWWGAFGTKEIPAKTQATPVPAAMLIPIGILASGAFLGLFPGALQKIASAATNGLPGHAHIALWSGLAPFLITAGVILNGVLLAYYRAPVSKFQQKVEFRGSAVRAYSWLVRELEVFASVVTGLMQRGSLPSELATIFGTAIAATVYGLLRWNLPDGLPPVWDSPMQLGIVIVGVVAAFVTVTSMHRIKAVLALGAVGMSVSLLFAQYGAPDLALTQLAVEAVSVVVFILVLRKLPAQFSHRPLVSSRLLRAVIAVGAGLTASIGGYFAFMSRTADPVSTHMPLEAQNFGYGQNIVNVILVDIRAWDTVGELSVLLVTATGVASLIYVTARTGKISRPGPEKRRGQFLIAADTVAESHRSVVLEVSTRLLFPTMIMLSLWLLFVGHNNPGGGFAGGVIAGLAFVLRYLAGGRYELGEAMPIPASYLLGTGLFVAAAGGAMPLLYGRSVLQSVPVKIPLGALGNLHFTTAMVLDVGVYILVTGLIIDLVSALGAEIDRQSERSSESRSKGRAALRGVRR